MPEPGKILPLENSGNARLKLFIAESIIEFGKKVDGDEFSDEREVATEVIRMTEEIIAAVRGELA